jgi:pimeloyl-ACP methyl ester carboxylesterase
MRSAIFYIAFAMLLPCAARPAQIALTDLSRLNVQNAQAEVTVYQGSHALRLTGKGGAPGDGLAVIRDLEFHNGTIDLDLAGTPGRGADEAARGFIGIAFHLQGGGGRFETIYLRPTNGRAADQLRRNHATQYASMPDWPWDRLRKESPGTYESYTDLAAGEWTHLRIEVRATNASLYVGGAAQPCLLIHNLKLGDITGAIALWIGPGTEGYFRNLTISGANEAVQAYGSNDSAGHYVQTADAKIYYERYGDGGRPLVLLHGGEYGYIDEFGDLIREMSKRRTVIAIATRGYGRSERGRVRLSHRQFAQDAAAVIDDIFKSGEKVDVLGFSEGAITSYLLASAHPERVNRLIAIGGPLGSYGQTMQSLEADPLTPELMQKQVPDLVASRKKIMAKPEQWEPLIRELDQMYREPVFVRQEEVRAIQAPTLIMAGDRDYYNRAESLLDIYHLLPKGQLAFIPGCGHVVLDCRADLVIGLATAFLDQPDK